MNKKAYVGILAVVGGTVGSGCSGARSYVFLPGAYQDVPSLNNVLGFTHSDKDGDNLKPTRAFDLRMPVAPAAYSGSADLSDAAKAQLDGNAKAALGAAAQQCVGQLGISDTGFSVSHVESVNFRQEIRPALDDWKPTAGPAFCCSGPTAKTDNSLCGDYVLTSIYYTDVTYNSSSHVGAGVTGSVTCAVGLSDAGASTSGQLTASVSADNTAQFTSSGWNVIGVAKLNDVCQWLAQVAAQPSDAPAPAASAPAHGAIEYRWRPM